MTQDTPMPDGPDVRGLLGMLATALHPTPKLTAESPEFLRVVDDVITQVMMVAGNARAHMGLHPTVIITCTVPYHPPMRPLWEAAEAALAEAFIELDWRLWNVWDVPRELLGDFDPRHLLRLSDTGIPLVARPGRGVMTAYGARETAARYLAAADLVDQLSTEVDSR